MSALLETLLNRRALLKATAMLAATEVMSKSIAPALALAPDEFGPENHALSLFDEPYYKPGFTHYDYVNPKAPKGGTLALQITSVAGNQNFLTYNTLNMYSAKGDGAAGMELIFDTLMSGSGDDLDSLYGLVARAVQKSGDGLKYRFHLRPEARFHDGSPLTAEDVAFSLITMKTKGYPVYGQLLKDVVEARALAPQLLELVFAPNRTRDLPLFVAAMPIFSKAYYGKQDFEAGTLESPLGSGAYRVEKIDVGRSITFKRAEDYWGKHLPSAIGLNNFEHIRYEYFREREAAFQGFTAGVFNFHEENSSIFWATRYNFPAFNEGKVKRMEVKDSLPSGAQGWFLNQRRAQFKDKRIREAMNYAFDFEWTNRDLMYGLYARTTSFFENSELKAVGKPSAEELQLLEPYRKDLPEEVFGEPFLPPVSDGTGQDRNLLRKASELLTQAGCKRGAGNMLMLPDGKPFTVEILEDSQALAKHNGGFIKNLRLLGIDATSRTVDATQFQRRVDEYDFDVMSRRHSFSLTPGEALRVTFGSKAANLKGGRNLAGINDPIVDALIEKVIDAKNRAELTIACRALDRVLRAARPWVPMWFSGKHRLVYWDQFSWPEKGPRYGKGAPSTWWYDAEKAKKL